MNKYKSTALIFAVIISTTFAQSFKFAALSDSRGKYNGVNDPVVTALITHMMKTNPDIKITVRDDTLYEGSLYRIPLWFYIILIITIVIILLLLIGKLKQTKFYKFMWIILIVLFLIWFLHYTGQLFFLYMI